jgi:hypothetical protein
VKLQRVLTRLAGNGTGDFRRVQDFTRRRSCYGATKEEGAADKAGVCSSGLPSHNVSLNSKYISSTYMPMLQPAALHSDADCVFVSTKTGLTLRIEHVLPRS